MQSISANDAKARFGQLLDASRREPVTIEKHGRAVAVVMSKEDYDEIQAMKLERLRSEVQLGIEASKAGLSTQYDASEVGLLATEIKAEGRKRTKRKA
ncbi:MAG TPA: prevent-host-death family protein [Gammaproteobacteria bacterium]|jgi:prevent-host-death family protein|nr:prevent-host-death family protein [Gammaproteobacteria bacterium]